MWIIFKIIITLTIANFLPNNLWAQNINFTNNLNETISNVNIVYTNRSIASCGEGTNKTIFSSLDIYAILSISNMISIESIPFTTNWDNFIPEQLPINQNSSSIEIIEKLPSDAKLIVFLCLSWSESSRLKLFTIPDEAIKNITENVMKKKPWSSLQTKIAQRIDKFSYETIHDFVYLILRGNVYTSVRGNMTQNQTYWSTPFYWQTPLQNNQRLKKIIYP